jgi:hypothetical protein
MSQNYTRQVATGCRDFGVSSMSLKSSPAVLDSLYLYRSDKVANTGVSQPLGLRKSEVSQRSSQQFVRATLGSYESEHPGYTPLLLNSIIMFELDGDKHV